MHYDPGGPPEPRLSLDMGSLPEGRRSRITLPSPLPVLIGYLATTNHCCYCRGVGLLKRFKWAPTSPPTSVRSAGCETDRRKTECLKWNTAHCRCRASVVECRSRYQRSASRQSMNSWFTGDAHGAAEASVLWNLFRIVGEIVSLRHQRICRKQSRQSIRRMTENSCTALVSGTRMPGRLRSGSHAGSAMHAASATKLPAHHPQAPLQWLGFARAGRPTAAQGGRWRWPGCCGVGLPTRGVKGGILMLYAHPQTNSRNHHCRHRRFWSAEDTHRRSDRRTARHAVGWH